MDAFGWVGLNLVLSPGVLNHGLNLYGCPIQQLFNLDLKLFRENALNDISW